MYVKYYANIYNTFDSTLVYLIKKNYYGCIYVYKNGIVCKLNTQISFS